MLAEDLLKCSLKFFPVNNIQPGLVHVLCDEHVQRQPHPMQCTHRLTFKHSCMWVSFILVSSAQIVYVLNCPQMNSVFLQHLCRPD